MEKFVLQKIYVEKEFNEFYKILEDSFPEDERRSEERQKELFKNNLYRVICYKKNNEIIAFIAYWNFSDFYYIEHFAVKKSYRNNKIGSRMLRDFLDSVNSKVILEVEYPEDKITKARINFYKRMGFFLNDYKYIQPSYEEGRKEIPLKIMSYKSEIDENEYNAFKDAVYSYVYKK